MDAHDDPIQGDLPLRDRLPEYGAVFGVGLLGTVIVGMAIGLMTDAGVATAIGYTTILYGIVFLLAGGATGGGYTSIGVGAVTAMFQGRRTDEEQSEIDEAWGRSRKLTPEERLHRGLRPEANPRAFWQVVGGFGYVAIGLLIVILSG